MILGCPNCESKFRVPDGAIGPNGRKVKCRKCGNQWHANQDDDLEGGMADIPANAQGPVDAGSMDDIARSLIAKMDSDDADAPPPPAAPEMGPEVDPEVEDEPDAPAPPPEDVEFGPQTNAYGGQNEDDRPEDFPTLGRGGDFGSDSDFVMEERRHHKPGRTPRAAWLILLVAILGAAGYLYLERNAVVHTYPPAEKLYRMIGLKPDLVGYGLELPQPQSGRLGGTPTTLFLEGVVRNTLDTAIDIPMLQGSLMDSDGNAIHTWTFEANKSRALPTEEIPYRTEVVSPPRGAVEAIVTFATPEEAMMMSDDVMTDEAEDAQH